LGGVLESYKVYSMAQAKNIPPPHNFRFGPGFAATAQLSFLFPNVIFMEMPWFRLEADILREGLKILNGYIRLADLPGLGMVIDENVVHKYRIKEFPRK
jgi:L-alanine-DL-glutamate epimerase-like enolase superfamily enzyme